MTKLAMSVLLVCMLIMYCQSYSSPKAIPNPKAQDVGKTHNDFVGTLLSSDRDGDFFPVNANDDISGIDDRRYRGKNTACVYDFDCPRGHRCESGQCAKKCWSDDNCPSHEPVCSRTVCMNLSGWKQVCHNCVCGNNRNGETGTREELGSASSLEQCELKCIDTPGCEAVEYWEGNSACFNCLRPDKHERYYNFQDAGHPVSVHEQGQEKSRFKCYGWTKDDLKQIFVLGGFSIDNEKKTCQDHKNFVFSQGDASKAPGCGGCWCCQPDN